MIKLSLTFAFLVWAIICLAQTNYHLNKDTSEFKKEPIWVVYMPHTPPFILSYLNAIIPKNVKSIKICRNARLVKIYGEKAANGVIKVKLKKEEKLLDFDKLLTAFNIADSDRYLPVFIDSTIAYQPQNIYAEYSLIKYIKIEKEEYTGMKYISIRSIYDITRPKKGEIHIRGNLSNIKTR